MTAMTSLQKIQDSVLAALYDRDKTVVAAAIDDAGLPPGARIQIYRNSSTLIHTAALRTIYPAVLALTGEEFFETAAIHYRRGYPSTSGNLQNFGLAFGEFLATLPNTESVPYLPDVARLEWLRQEAALAADILPEVAPMDQMALLQNQRPDLSLVIHPGVRLFTSPHAVLTLWRFAMEADPGVLNLPDDGEQVILWRCGCEVAMATVDQASFACIEGLIHGNSIGAACDAAKVYDTGFDLAACLNSLIEQNLVIHSF